MPEANIRPIANLDRFRVMLCEFLEAFLSCYHADYATN